MTDELLYGQDEEEAEYMADQRDDEEAYLYFTVMELEGVMRQFGVGAVLKAMSAGSVRMLKQGLVEEGM